jgi:hypothetical protein
VLTISKDYKNFITGYLGIPIYLILIFGYKFWHKTKGVPPKEADFYTGKDEIDREEAAFLAFKAQQAEEKGGKSGSWFYKVKTPPLLFTRNCHSNLSPRLLFPGCSRSTRRPLAVRCLCFQSLA